MIDDASPLELENPLWRFSLRAYALPGIAPTCLDLQNRHGIDVNLLMFWMWAGIVPGIQADPDLLKRADDHVAAWRENIVLPLRGARSWAKGQAFMRDEACFRLRESIKREELEAERVQQAMLHRFSRGLPATDMPRERVARANVDLFLHMFDVRQASAVSARFVDAAKAACASG